MTPGLFALIVVLSDNDEYGACFLLVNRLADLLNREPDNIRKALLRLRADGLIGAEERYRDTKLHWPLIPKCLAGNASIHWLVDYYAPSRKPGPKPPIVEEGRIELYPIVEEGIVEEGTFGKPPLVVEETSPRGARGDLAKETWLKEDIHRPNGGAHASRNGAHHPNGSGDSKTGSVSPEGHKRGAAAAGPAATEISAGFEEWWQYYPRKDDKADAKKAYTATVSSKRKDGLHATIEELAGRGEAVQADVRATIHQATGHLAKQGLMAQRRQRRWRVQPRPGAGASQAEGRDRRAARRGGGG